MNVYISSLNLCASFVCVLVFFFGAWACLLISSHKRCNQMSPNFGETSWNQTVCVLVMRCVVFVICYCCCCCWSHHYIFTIWPISIEWTRCMIIISEWIWFSKWMYRLEGRFRSIVVEFNLMSIHLFGFVLFWCDWNDSGSGEVKEIGKKRDRDRKTFKKI